MSWLFISDLHLCQERPALTQVFRSFLAGPCREAQRLYILGDLFEYWAGDDDLNNSLGQQVAQALTQAAAGGLSSYFMAGNRDFLLGPRFAAQAQLTLLTDPFPLELGPHRALLLHGDTLCTDDTAYQAFRRQVRDPAWQATFLARPLAERLAIVGQIRSHSEAAKHDKSAAIMDVNPTAVEAALRDSDSGLLIHGHTHRPAHHTVLVDGQTRERWVLPDWRSDDCAPYLAWDGQVLENRIHQPK